MLIKGRDDFFLEVYRKMSCGEFFYGRRPQSLVFQRTPETNLTWKGEKGKMRFKLHSFEMFWRHNFWIPETKNYWLLFFRGDPPAHPSKRKRCCRFFKNRRSLTPLSHKIRVSDSCWYAAKIEEEEEKAALLKNKQLNVSPRKKHAKGRKSWYYSME